MAKAIKIVTLLCLGVVIILVLRWFIFPYVIAPHISEYKFREFLSALERGEVKKAADYVHYYGEKHSKYSLNPDLPVITAEEEKELWISGMNRVKEKGIDFISHKSMRVRTDDSFTSGSVILIINYNERTYDIKLYAHLNEGKLSPGGVQGLGSYPHPDTTVQYIVGQINAVIPTADPG